MTGKEKAQLRKKICDRFQKVSSLRRWVEVSFGAEEVHRISWSTLNNAAFELIQRAKARGWIDTLIEKLDDC